MDSVSNIGQCVKSGECQWTVCRKVDSVVKVDLLLLLLLQEGTTALRLALATLGQLLLGLRVEG